MLARHVLIASVSVFSMAYASTSTEICGECVTSLSPAPLTVNEHQIVVTSARSLFVVTHASRFYDRTESMKSAIHLMASKFASAGSPQIYVVDEPVEHERRGTAEQAFNHYFGLMNLDGTRSETFNEYALRMRISPGRWTSYFLPEFTPHRYVNSSGSLKLRHSGEHAVLAGTVWEACLGGTFFSLVEPFARGLTRSRRLTLDVVADATMTVCFDHLNPESERAITWAECQRRGTSFTDDVKRRVESRFNFSDGRLRVEIDDGRTTEKLGRDGASRTLIIRLRNAREISVR